MNTTVISLSIILSVFLGGCICDAEQEIVAVTVTINDTIPGAHVQSLAMDNEDNSIYYQQEFETDSSGNLDFEIYLEENLYYIISSDTLGIKDTISEVNIKRDRCEKIEDYSYKIDGQRTREIEINY